MSNLPELALNSDKPFTRSLNSSSVITSARPAEPRQQGATKSSNPRGPEGARPPDMVCRTVLLAARPDASIRLKRLRRVALINHSPVSRGKSGTQRYRGCLCAAVRPLTGVVPLHETESMPSDIKVPELMSLASLPLEGDPRPPSLTHRMLSPAHSSLSGKAPRAEHKPNLSKVVLPVPGSKAYPAATCEPLVKGPRRHTARPVPGQRPLNRGLSQGAHQASSPTDVQVKVSSVKEGPNPGARVPDTTPQTWR